MPGALADRLFAYVAKKHPRSLPGVLEARDVEPERFALLSERLLSWALTAKGTDFLESMVDDFVQFSYWVNIAQARYEVEQAYPKKSNRDCFEALYGVEDQMTSYLWGVYLTNFLWAHHLEISLFFEDRFIPKLPIGVRVVEIAPGHGGWGIQALHRLPTARLNAFDISKASVEIAKSIAQAAGVGARASYIEGDAMSPTAAAESEADACICSFLIEHLDDPSALLQRIAKLLKPNGLLFLTGALTAAQEDHIFEFKRESEILTLVEQAGLRMLESISVAPRRTLPKARFLPRSMAVIAQKTAFAL